MRRRDFLRNSAGAAGILAAPRPRLAADSKMLRFVPQANLANLDPIWTTQYVVRNGSLLIWDMLYGVNDKLEPQPQMVEGHEVTPDFKTWTFKLRAGPEIPRQRAGAGQGRRRQHQPLDGARRDHGRADQKRLDALEAVDDRDVPLPPQPALPEMLFALGKSSTPCLFIMPERIAATDPFKQITEYVGSGPMRFKKDEWVPGAKAVFEQFDGYVPRAEKANWLSGGKRINFDRIEWQIVAGCRHRRRRVAERRGRLAGDAVCPTWSRCCRKPRRRRRYRRSAGQYRLVPDQPSVSAVQRRAGAPRGADRAQPGRLHAARSSATTRRCGRRCRGSSRRTRRFTPRTAANR